MRLIRPTVAVTLTAATALLFAGQAPAGATSSTLAPETHFTLTVAQDGTVTAPTSGAAIPNIDSDKSTLRTYYGATKQDDPAHAFDSTLAPATTYLPNLTDSPYAKNTEAVAAKILAALPDPAPADNDAVVFDVDSTLLSDYGNEEDSAFNYSAALNAVWVNHELFPAVAGMPALVQKLASEGYQIFGITGRPSSQEDATIANLTQQGYTSDGTTSGTPLFDNDNLFTKWDTTDPTAKPSYIGTCTLSPTCNTVEYKANTRKHIVQDLGDDIVMNVGDQWSDLEGGYADAYQKMPNPSYFLPAADIAGAPASDKSMVLPAHYTMAPDGSSGNTTDGDTIPNETAVVAAIRGYYNAPASGTSKGIADKSSSNYITELSSLEKTWTSKITTSCQKAVAAVAHAKSSIATAKRNLAKAKKALKKAKTKKARRAARAAIARARKHASAKVPGKPAVVFDADDTTLWTYDMEDGAMGFNYNPTLQNSWVQNRQFPAVPGMPELVSTVADAGCTVLGLTGRSDSQKYATLGNLAQDGYTGFTAQNFYTKWNTGATPPAYVHCKDMSACTTIEFKSSVRKYLEKSRGFHIVANLGDQFSDLIGGYADATYKLPNPTYYLP